MNNMTWHDFAREIDAITEAIFPAVVWMRFDDPRPKVPHAYPPQRVIFDVVPLFAKDGSSLLLKRVREAAGNGVFSIIGDPSLLTIRLKTPGGMIVDLCASIGPEKEKK